MTVKTMSKEELSLYRRWAAMKARCNPNIKHDERHSKNYTDKGIRVCPEWQKWHNFRDWSLSHGYKMELTLDRKDGDDDYYPDNCRWVDWKTQGKNKSETALKDREERKEVAKEKRDRERFFKRNLKTVEDYNKYLTKDNIKGKTQQKVVKLTEIEKFRLWHAEVTGTEVQKLTRSYMRSAIDAKLYNPNWEPGTPAGFFLVEELRAKEDKFTDVGEKVSECRKAGEYN